MDEEHLASAFRYVALNPVHARVVGKAEDWRRSSTRTHIAGASDAFVDTAPAIDRVGDFRQFLDQAIDDDRRLCGASEGGKRRLPGGLQGLDRINGSAAGGPSPLRSEGRSRSGNDAIYARVTVIPGQVSRPGSTRRGRRAIQGKWPI